MLYLHTYEARKQKMKIRNQFPISLDFKMLRPFLFINQKSILQQQQKQ